MKLSDWSSIAEIVSGVAVVVTLIFLVFGIRENSAITRAVAYERNVDSRNEWRMWVSQDDERLRIYQAFLAGRIDDLTDLESSRLASILNIVWAINEKSYYSNQYGILGPEEWARTDRVLCTFYGNFDAERWERISRTFTDEFTEYVETKCSGSP